MAGIIIIVKQKRDTKYCRKTNSKEIIFCHCGLNCHKANRYPKNKKEACIICQKTNHVKDCFYRNKHGSTKENNRKVTFLTCNSIFYTQDFVLDSGSSSHMVNKNLF